ncbi:perlucin-like [Haliotis cracherodii]|uniref:perlucin-like n=1 Tax=Haliotis cracherodii TaxID=6455 RepID=UPI0039E919B5
MWIPSVTVFLFLAITTRVSGENCPSGFMRHFDFCYSLIRFTAIWADAAVYCQAIGSHLAYVETAAEQTFLEGYLKRESSTIHSSGVWLGGLTYLTENEWQWRFKGGRITNTWWSPGNPDHDGDQFCLMLFKSQAFKWNDAGCSYGHYFLCELELEDAPNITGK